VPTVSLPSLQHPFLTNTLNSKHIAHSPNFGSQSDQFQGAGLANLSESSLKQTAEELHPATPLPSVTGLTQVVEKLEPLQNSHTVKYAVIDSKGQVSSPYPQAKALLKPFFSEGQHHPKKPLLVLLNANGKGVEERLEQLKKPDGKGLTIATHDPGKGIEIDRSFMLADTVANLIEGRPESVSKPVQNLLPEFFTTGKSPDKTKLAQFYKVSVPGHPDISNAINAHAETQKVKRQLLGLELLKKVYAEGELEVASVLVSAGAGAIGEPLIGKLFPGGGATASNMRTGLMSFLDIMGNVLSTFGMAKDKLAEQGKSFSLSDKTAQHLLKSGLVGGGAGGVLLGVPMNYPAGVILSDPHASVAARATIGGLSAAGSAVAIPKEVAETKAHYQAAIEQLIKQGKIQYPGHVKSESGQKAFVSRLANQEMNLRLNTAASIKATSPLPLVGTGFVTLMGEKLGIPRHVVQTAFMATAPVMHNVLRLGFAVNEKYRVIPKRIKTLEALVYDADQKKMSSEERREKIGTAFLPNKANRLTNAIGNKAIAYGAALGMLGVEIAYLRSEKQRTSKAGKVGKTTFSTPETVQDKTIDPFMAAEVKMPKLQATVSSPSLALPSGASQTLAGQQALSQPAVAVMPSGVQPPQNSSGFAMPVTGHLDNTNRMPTTGSASPFGLTTSPGPMYQSSASHQPFPLVHQPLPVLMAQAR
jgi:hypothetical protein